MADFSAQPAAQPKAKQWIQEVLTMSSPNKSKEIGSLMKGPVSPMAGSCSSSGTEDTSKKVIPSVAWNSSPSVVTWYCVQRVGPKTLSNRDDFSPLDEATGAYSTKSSLPMSNEVESCGENLDIDEGQQPCEPEKLHQTHKIDFGFNFRKASNYFIAVLTRKFSVSRLRISSERAQRASELRIKFECAKQSLRETEQRFLASESELISTLLNASDALEIAQDVKKKWGWLTMPSTLREIQSLKERLQSTRTELEALRASFRIERAQLITIVNDFERQCIADESVKAEHHANRSNSTKSLDSKRSSSFKNRIMAWTSKSKVDSSACSSQKYRNLPSVVTWHLQRSIQEAENKSVDLSLKIPSVQRSVSQSKMSNVLSRILRPGNVAKISTPTAPKEFRMLPSVVTWCSPQAMQKARVAPGYETSAKLSIVSAVSPKSPTMTILARMSQGISSVFSSGSTLSVPVKSKSKSETKDFRHQPSVVTWLVIRKPAPLHHLVPTETASRNTVAKQLTSSEEVRLIDSVASLPCTNEVVYQGIALPSTANFTSVTMNQVYFDKDRRIADVLGAGSRSSSLPSVVTWHIHKTSSSQVTGDKRARSSRVNSTPTSGSFMTKMIRSFSYPFSKAKPSIHKVDAVDCHSTDRITASTTASSTFVKNVDECGGDESCHSPVSCPSPARLSEAGTCLKAQGGEYSFSASPGPALTRGRLLDDFDGQAAAVRPLA